MHAYCILTQIDMELPCSESQLTELIVHSQLHIHLKQGIDMVLRAPTSTLHVIGGQTRSDKNGFFVPKQPL